MIVSYFMSQTLSQCDIYSMNYSISRRIFSTWKDKDSSSTNVSTYYFFFFFWEEGGDYKYLLMYLRSMVLSRSHLFDSFAPANMLRIPIFFCFLFAIVRVSSASSKTHKPFSFLFFFFLTQSPFTNRVYFVNVKYDSITNNSS